MLALWYTVLSYKEYRDTIWDKLSSSKTPTAKETAIVCPLPPKKVEPPSKIPVAEPASKIPVAEPPKPQRSLPTPPPTPPIPTPQPTSIPKPKIPETPIPQQKMAPPPKPPRAPSPHPIMAEVLDDDIDYDEEESEASEPDEEDSVLAMPQFQRKPVAKSVNEFIDKEKM